MCVVLCTWSLSRVWLFCDPMDCSPPGSSIHGLSQAVILEWVAILFSRGSFQPRDRTCVSCISRWIPYHWVTWEVPAYTWRALITLSMQHAVHLWSCVSSQEVLLGAGLLTNVLYKKARQHNRANLSFPVTTLQLQPAEGRNTPLWTSPSPPYLPTFPSLAAELTQQPFLAKLAWSGCPS